MESFPGNIERLLLPEEVLVFKTRLHRSIKSGPYISGLWASLWLGVGFARYSGSHDSSDLLVGAVLVAISAAVGCASYMVYRNAEFAVTTNRVIACSGIMVKRVAEMHLSKVETVTLEQGPAATLMKYGTVVVHGSGGSFERLRNIELPVEFSNALIKQVAMVQGKPH